MFVPNEPQFMQSGTLGALPVFWAGVNAVDGDAHPFNQVPEGSVYIRKDLTNSMVTVFQKMKNDGADNDYSPIGGGGVIAETVLYSDFTDGGSTVGTYVMKTSIPQGAYVQHTILQDVTGFTGDTSATLQVGDGTDVDRYSTGTPSIFTTANAIDMGAVSGTAIHTASKTVTLTVTSGADFTSVSAGQMTVKIFYWA